jgi:hypothetical protein
MSQVTKSFKRSKGVKLNGILECKLLSKNAHGTSAPRTEEDGGVNHMWMVPVLEGNIKGMCDVISVVAERMAR